MSDEAYRRSIDSATKNRDWKEVVQTARQASLLFPELNFWKSAHVEALSQMGLRFSLKDQLEAFRSDSRNWTLLRNVTALLDEAQRTEEALDLLSGYFADTGKPVAKLAAARLRGADAERMEIAASILGLSVQRSSRAVFVGRFTEGLMNGLGNKMFAMATGYSIATQNDADLIVADVFGWGQNSHLKRGHEFHHSGDGLPGKMSAVYPSFRYADPDVVDELATARFREAHPWELSTVSHESGLGLEGCFIRYEYFDSHRQDLQRLFRLSDAASAELEANPLFAESACSIGIHVRRTDHSDQHPEFGQSFYRRALAHIPDDMPIIFFSDDPTYCAEQLLPLEVFRPRKCAIAVGNRNYVDLELLRRCQHHILQFSTLGWWGAYLSDSYPSNVVVRPRAFAKVGPAGWISEPIVGHAANETVDRSDGDG